MTKDQIQANKPDGATHYRIGVIIPVIYYRLLDNGVLEIYLPKSKEWLETAGLDGREGIKPL